MPRLEDRIAEWMAQSPVCTVTGPELQFIADMRKAAAAGVGYGWMQQICEWEWAAKGPAAWGPEYFHRRITELETAANKEGVT